MNNADGIKMIGERDATRRDSIMFGKAKSANGNLNKRQVAEFAAVPDMRDGNEDKPGLDAEARPTLDTGKKRRFGKGFAKGPGAADEWGNSAKFRGG
jgi:hypothetical protein